MKPNVKEAKYWAERFRQLEASNNRSAVAMENEILGLFTRTEKRINADVEVWLERLAKNNGINMQEARKLLTAGELREFKWTVREYIKAGKGKLTPEVIKQLENASARYHISRLEAIKAQMLAEVESLYGEYGRRLTGHLAGLYRGTYYHTAFEVQRGLGVGFTMHEIDRGKIEKILGKPWALDGENFSERIWTNKTKLVGNLYNVLGQAVITGEDPGKTITKLSKAMNTSRYNAGRVVMTESAYFGEEAKSAGFKDLGIEEYEIIATLDDKTSEICQQMDGQRFKLSDREVGVNAPPFHVFCRSTTAPAITEKTGERIARGQGGKTYYVPASMTYKEWAEKFLKEESPK